MNNNDDRRKPYPGNRAQGAGRRTYPRAAGNAPRVGRIAQNVPRARQVGPEEDAAFTAPEASRPAFHRGSAYRAPTGPRQYKRAMDEGQTPMELPDDEHLLAGRNPIREALKAGRPVEKLLVASGDLSGAAQEIVRLAKEAGAVVQRVEPPSTPKKR